MIKAKLQSRNLKHRRKAGTADHRLKLSRCDADPRLKLCKKSTRQLKARFYSLVTP